MRYLLEHDFFQDFNRLEMWAIERTTTMFTCEPGRLFYSAGEIGEVLFILKEGTVHLYRLTSEGRKLIVATLTKGAVFGEMSLIGQGMHNTFAEVVRPARVCVMSRGDVETLLRQKPQMALRLMSIMGQRLQAAERQLEQLAFNRIPARLATLILALGEEGNEVRGHTHQELADMLGTYRETATLILNEFKGQGLIEIGRKQIHILDRPGLAAIAGESG
ncbi:MAG: Crp/Fnr family transcriptional regulator [Ardenticatenales bacterium]|nr:Crp/Fnr family transcriptional regulator [Ardenticatenales bacterium]